MAKLVLVKNESAELEGFGDANRSGYNRFRAHVGAMGVGELVSFEWRPPRSPKFHRRFFVMLHKLFERQEQYRSEDALRGWLTIGAGECEYGVNRQGVMCAFPKSIAWDKMDDLEFGVFVRNVDEFVWSEYARDFLWPHLSRQRTYDMVQQLQDEMDAR